MQSDTLVKKGLRDSPQLKRWAHECINLSSRYTKRAVDKEAAADAPLQFHPRPHAGTSTHRCSSISNEVNWMAATSTHRRSNAFREHANARETWAASSAQVRRLNLSDHAVPIP